MRFDTPATTNPIDQLKVIGKPTDRIDGPLKTTGTAPYAYDRYDVVANQAHGFVVGSAIAKGRIASIDLTEAKAASGVLAIVTAENAGKLGKGNFNTAKLLGGPDIDHYHQAIALVVAETFEQARAAAQLVQVDYVRAQGVFDLAAAKDSGKPVPGFGGPADTTVGDFAGAFATAPVQLDATYTTPDHAHAMMEPHASVAAWNGDKLTLWTSNQMIDWSTGDMAKTLGIAKENVRLISPFIGGGFGGKLWVRTDALLAALGARAAGRPVKVALPRPFMFNNTLHRPATIQRIRIGATSGGKITAIGHESWSGDLPGGKPEIAVYQTRLLYAGENRLTATRLAVLDLPEGNAMRAPGEAPGMMALESAIDEMAEKLGLDPIEFRIRNDTQVDPEKPERHFSQRRLIECLRIGADRFGWSKRNPLPGKTREGRWLVGMGVAAAFRNNLVMKSAARVRLDNRGIVTVETDMTDIGTGTYTIIAQTAAEMMGVSLDKVAVRLGDSTFPVSSGSGGQWGANCSTAGVYAACAKLREAVAQKLGFNSADAVFADGQVRSGNRSVPLAQAAGESGIVAEDLIEFGDLDKKYQQSTFGAHFVEVGVDAATAEIRMRRMLAVCAAGRILNPKSARSQVIGAMTMGAGAALMEELVVDKRYGFFVNHDLASYEVPVHADIPHQEVIFLDETDPLSSPMKAKGVGELGICGGRRGRRQRDLQCHRRARARLSNHARQAPRPAAQRRMSTAYRHHRLERPVADRMITPALHLAACRSSLAKHRRNIVKTLIAGFLALGAMMLAGGMSTPVHAQGPSAASTPAQRLMGDVAPKLAELTDKVLFGDVWERPQLSKRDRSLVTVSALIAMNRPDQLRSHLARARENGLTEEELVEAITHLAFYAGWPNAVTAVSVARDVFKKN